MHRVLLVDDERMILDGISSIINWEAQGTVLIGTARNGQEAYNFITEHQPDIVISDIRMPGLDGLQLVEKTKETFPAIEFILLSGFDEFDYARTAMKFGVRHYLLKPCNEQSIIQALHETVTTIMKRENRNKFLQNIENELKKVLPHVKQQFLKELVTNKTYGSKDWNDFKKMFELTLDDQQVRIILFQIEGKFEFENMFAIQNISEDIIHKQVMLLSTTIGKHVLILIKEQLSQEELFQTLEEIRTTFEGFYHMETTTALSDAGDISEARHMYRQTLECLNHRFYLGEGSLITYKDIRTSMQKDHNSFELDEERFILWVKAGRHEDVLTELDRIFAHFKTLRVNTIVAKSYLIQLYLSIIRQSESEDMQLLLKEVARMEEMDTLYSLQQFITKAAKDITASNYELNKRKNSKIINKVIDIILENLDKSTLSLQWVANEMIYMNADYLGKLFKKETNEKFSNYVMKARVDKAVKLMQQDEEFKVFEIAEKLGFGDNPQYFSQVFKKYTGLTPSEFMTSR